MTAQPVQCDHSLDETRARDVGFEADVAPLGVYRGHLDQRLAAVGTDIDEGSGFVLEDAAQSVEHPRFIVLVLRILALDDRDPDFRVTDLNLTIEEHVIAQPSDPLHQAEHEFA